MMRFLISMFLLVSLVGCSGLRKLNTVDEAGLREWLATQDAEERIEAENWKLIPPPRIKI
jgi:uncharacterized protein with NAD-binding domain and iron-sulfur cluster